MNLTVTHRTDTITFDKSTESKQWCQNWTNNQIAIY